MKFVSQHGYPYKKVDVQKHLNMVEQKCPIYSVQFALQSPNYSHHPSMKDGVSRATGVTSQPSNTLHWYKCLLCDNLHELMMINVQRTHAFICHTNNIRPSLFIVQFM